MLGPHGDSTRTFTAGAGCRQDSICGLVLPCLFPGSLAVEGDVWFEHGVVELCEFSVVRQPERPVGVG